MQYVGGGSVLTRKGHGISNKFRTTTTPYGRQATRVSPTHWAPQMMVSIQWLF